MVAVALEIVKWQGAEIATSTKRHVCGASSSRKPLPAQPCGCFAAALSFGKNGWFQTAHSCDERIDKRTSGFRYPL